MEGGEFVRSINFSVSKLLQNRHFIRPFLGNQALTMDAWCPCPKFQKLPMAIQFQFLDHYSVSPSHVMGYNIPYANITFHSYPPMFETHAQIPLEYTTSSYFQMIVLIHATAKTSLHSFSGQPQHQRHFLACSEPAWLRLSVGTGNAFHE